MKAGHPRNSPNRFDDKCKTAFLVALERSGEYKAACAAVSISYQTVYDHRQKYPDFQTACEDALGRNYACLLKVAYKLAVEGLITETYDKEGRVVHSKRTYSERILLKLLGRRDPAAWSDKVQVDQKATVEVRDKRVKTEDMTPRQQRAAREYLKTLLDDPARN